MSNLIERPSLLTNLTELRNTIDRLFTPTLLDWRSELPSVMTDWAPKIDLAEDHDKYIIHADMPGIEAKDIEITLENGMLTIKGEKESELKEEKKNYVRIERASGSFYRSISVPDAGDPAAITAKSKNGVLEIIVPKNKKTAIRKIAVKEE